MIRYRAIPFLLGLCGFFLIAVICQLTFAVGIYWLARFRVTYALIALSSVAALFCVWLLVMAPQLLE
jgi:hypothetical protein